MSNILEIKAMVRLVNVDEGSQLFFSLQVKYKEGKKDLSSSLYHLLPETEETKFAKTVTELQSEVQ